MLLMLVKGAIFDGMKVTQRVFLAASRDAGIGVGFAIDRKLSYEGVVSVLWSV